MKLKNKRTGEIVDVDFIYPETAEFFYPNFKLVDFNELFEDYEEPKEDGLDNIIALAEAYSSNDSERHPKEIVEKLKAWKRLKDNGFRFKRWEIIDGRIDFMILPKGEYREKVYDDLDLLFGGGE